MSKDKLESLLAAFESVWRRFRPELVGYVEKSLPQAKGGSLALMNYHAFEFCLDSKLAFFLPTLTGQGFLTFVLVHFLAKAQNEILKFYHQLANISQLVFSFNFCFILKIFYYNCLFFFFSSFECVEPSMVVNKDYVIHIESENELLSIVQSNFSFDSAHSTFSFRFDTIGDKIAERFFQTRPLIDLEVKNFTTKKK